MTARRPELILVFITFVWGSSFIAQRLGAAEVPAFLFNASRYGLAALAVFLYSLLKNVPRFDRPEALGLPVYYGYLLGFFLFLGATCQQMGMATTTAGKAGFLTTTYVVIVPFLAIFSGHHLRAIEVLAAAAALLGTYFISVNEVFFISTGDLWEIFGAFWWGLHVITISLANKSPRPLVLAYQQFFTCTLLSICCSFFLEGWDFAALLRVVPMIAYSGLFSIALCYTLQVLVQHHVTPSRAAVIYSMEALFAAVCGYLFLDEVFSVRMMFGAVLVLAGVLLAQAAPQKPV